MADQQTDISQQQSPMRERLDEMIRNAHTFNSSSARRMECLEAQMAQTLKLLQKVDGGHKTESITPDVVRNLTTSTKAEDRSESIESVATNPSEIQTAMNLSELVKQIQSLNSLGQIMPTQNRILRQLYFESIFRREDAVVHAAGETFQWIFTCSARVDRNQPENDLTSKTDDFNKAFEEPEEVHRLRTSISFTEFLRHDGGTFFISGKAGCGKSTIMKYIAHHEKTEACLRAWASTKRLILIKVFFWQSEDLRQGSMEGFFRSILFQVVIQCPDLIGELFPSSPKDHMPDAAGYRLSELEFAFQRLLELRSAAKYHFCCFIDGLDEHQGDNMSHEDLASRLILWSSMDNVKVVCSARPYTVFLKAFQATGAVVQLHQLTSSDISTFARFYFRDWLSKPDMLVAQNNCLSMVEDITVMAEGIFLWATFVVRDLINQCLDHDGSVSALRRRLQECLECGDSLDRLFQLMLQRVGKGLSLQIRSNMVLYFAANNPFELPLNALIYSWLDELGWFEGSIQAVFSVQQPQKPYTEGEISSRVERVRYLLHQLTRGLLEVVDTHDPVPYFRYRVGLCHRSVRDFLREHWRSGTREPPLSPMEEAQAYCRVRSLEAIRVPFRQTSPSDDTKLSSLDYDDSLKDNLRRLFEFTFIWLGSRKGITLPHQYLQEFERALLQTQEIPTPYLPGHLLIKLDDLGRYYPRNTITRTSFLHWAAYWSQGEFIKWQLADTASDNKDTTPSSELSLLLSCSVAADVETTKYLLHQKFKPGSQVQIMASPDQDSTSTADAVRKATGQHVNSRNKTATVWMIFLRDFAMNVRAYCRKRKHASTSPLYMNRDWLERLSKVIEAYLSAGADPRVYFVLFADSPRGTYSVDLYQILDVFKPENLASIATLLSRRMSWWKSLMGGRVSATTPPTTQYVTMDILLSGDWKVIGICSETGQELLGGFEVRVF